MQSLLDRLAALDAARLVALSGALLTLLLAAAWLLATATSVLEPGPLAAAAVAVMLALIGLLYAFELGNPSTSG